MPGSYRYTVLINNFDSAVAKLPFLYSLTPDQRIWRVVWFGECAYPGSVSRYAQPSIKVVLSPLKCDSADDAELPFPDSTDRDYTHEAWVSVASLPMLSIGDLWQHGQRISSPDYEVETFHDLKVNHETASFVKAGFAVEGKFLLPLLCHPWHFQHTQSYCVAVSLKDGRRLLVPCVELIRFYFGSSSNLVQRLFSAPLKSDRFWKSKQFNPKTGHLHLALADHISSASSKDIGRIAESRLAWRAAAGIHASCQKATANGRPAYPCTGFPFEGVTDLVASGIWLPLGDRERATFLAFRLRSCAYPFPFQSLSYTPGDWKARSDASNGSDNGSGQSIQKRSSDQPSVAVDVDPGINRAQRGVAFTSQERFPDLCNKRVWQDHIEVIPVPDVYIRRADGSLEQVAQVAMGESQWSSTVSGVDVSVVEDRDRTSRKPVRLPKFVRDGLREIGDDPSYCPSNRAITIVCPDGKVEPVFSLPVIVNDTAELASQSLYTDGRGKARQRRGCFVSIVGFGLQQQYLLVLEGRNRFARSSVVSIEDTNLQNIVRIAVLADL